MGAPVVPVPTHIEKESIAAAVRTRDHLIVGLLHARPNKRLKDELNHVADPYIAVTQARVYDAADLRLLYETRFILVANSQVVSVCPLTAITAGPGAWTEVLMRAGG